jgi:hypothetical protein
MNAILKKTAAIILVVIILCFTIIALLGIWGVINLENVMWKAIQSLMVVFIASAIMLFIFTYLVKDKDHKQF